MRPWPLAVLLLSAAAFTQQGPKPLQVLDSGVRQTEDGPAVPPSAAFVPGETVFYSFQVQGYGVSGAGAVNLSYRIDVRDPGGVSVVEPKEGKVQATLASQDKDWLPRVRYEFVLPPHVLGGRFRVEVLVRDGQAPREARAETPLTVQSRQVDVEGPLSVRGLQFLKGDAERVPLASPVYRAGETLSARFDVVGFERGEKNRIRVSYGVSILAPSGKVLFSEPQAAVEEDAPFYAKRFVPGEAGLTVRPGTAAGTYTLLVTARDEVGGATCEARGEFRIE